jgi:hypothetical protein
LDNDVKLLKKTRSVTLLQRRRPSRYCSCAAKLGQQVPSSDGLADVVFREQLPGRADDKRAFLQAAVRERDVSGDHNVAWLHVFDNPIVGCIESVLHDLEHNPSFLGNSHPGVGHQGDIQTISAGDAVDLVFDRARIGIYKDVQQVKTLTITPRV